MNINDFYMNDYLSFAGYDNWRKIASYVDGLKPSARKCIYTILSKNISNPKKVSQIKSSVAEYTSYIHGDDSLVGVIVNLAQNFVGANNIPLLKCEGNFGNRTQPSASAARYIFTCKEDYLDLIFNSDDNNVLIEQIFEGEKIEPKYYVPIIPLILVNGSEGLSVGFSQKILPRNPIDLVNAIKEILDDKEISIDLIPYFKGFSGKVFRREEGGFEIHGTFKKIGDKLVIDELPIGYDLKSYKKVLNTLEEKKVISDYNDLTDTKTDKFQFSIKYKDLDKKTDYEILETFKLIKRVSENFTTMDENNVVKVFSDEKEILKNYVNIRLQYYTKRKEYKIEKIEYELLILRNKLKFISDIISKKLIISNKSKQNIIEQMDELNYYNKIEDSYDYLLRMQMYSLTSEKIDELKTQLLNKKNELNELKNKDIKDWYKEDLDKLMEKIK